MTGIADVVRSARSCWRPCVPFVLAFLSWIAQRVPGNIRALVLAWIVALSEDGLLCMPQPRLGFFQENEDACNPFLSDNNGRFTIESLPADEAHFWGLLLPVCCRATDGGEDCFLRLVALAESIEATSTLNDRAHLMIFFGIDQHDLFFDRDDTKLRITQIFMTIGIPNDAIHISILRSHYRGKLCRIWDFLAGKAVEEGCCFSLLVGDDVRFLTKDWKVEVEQQFSSIALRCKLPYGMACVALRDVTFSVFPTFPVIHRSHFAVFGCLFPVQFVNQHGDPFLFEVYRRLGASEFAKVASLENTIGGAGESRYSKQSVQWQGDVLSIAVSKLLHSSGLQQPVVCIDVIIPTFRCDLSYLNTLTQLGVSSDCCSVHFLVVVDNPGSDTARNLVILNDWSPNHLVRVKYNDCNIGASASRNVGIATSCGDWLVLLDDDVIPDSHLLDAYLGAILRHPNAKILVGLTSLPAPETLMQQALMASQMTFFYDVAKRMKNPPWGVTANLCIQGRTCDRVIWFNSNYPFSGGGEDVDFCLRIKGLLPIHARHEAVVAVPEARVNHPFWTNVTQQVVGWAFGDVLCLNYLPDQAFYAPPCWIEFIFIHSVVVVLWFKWSSWPQFAVMAMTVTALEVAMIACNSFSNTGAARLYWRRVVVAIVSALPVMAQDLVRLWSKLRRLRFSHLCMRLDWMDGRAEHVSATRFALTVKAVFFVVAAVLSVVDWRWWLIGAVVLSGLVLLWNQSLHFSPAREVQARLQQLQPLPVDFPPDGPQPFIVLASQRTGSNLLCGMLHNHSQIVMHNEVFNQAKIWTYQNEDIRNDPSWKWDISSFPATRTPSLSSALFSSTSLKKRRMHARRASNCSPTIATPPTNTHLPSPWPMCALRRSFFAAKTTWRCMPPNCAPTRLGTTSPSPSTKFA